MDEDEVIEAATEETEAETTEDSGETGEAGEETAGERVMRVYIGPSIPYERLRNGQILTGTEESIGAFLKPLEERYPELKYLMAEPAELAAARRKVRTSGNILHKYYQDMAAKARVSRKGKRRI